MSDYPYIRAWGRMMGSSNDFIREETAVARRDLAPQDVLYRSIGPNAASYVWVRFSESEMSESTRDQILRWLPHDERP